MGTAFIAILYLTAPAVSSFARLNFINTVDNTAYTDTPNWFKNWEDIGLISWTDKNKDGIIQYRSGNALEKINLNLHRNEDNIIKD